MLKIPHDIILHDCIKIKTLQNCGGWQAVTSPALEGYEQDLQAISQRCCGRESCGGWKGAGLGEFFAVVQSLSHIRLFAAPWTAAHQASLSFTWSNQAALTAITALSPEPVP